MVPTHSLPWHYGGVSVSVTLRPRIPTGKGPLYWVVLRDCLDTEVRGKITLPLPVIEPVSPGGPARSQTLY
jgi:hypothetical protein